jgi:curved DNA-binding protein CbpA
MRLSEAYEILGIPPDSDSDIVKAAYRQRVQAAHPDKGGTAHEFIRVQAAYELLCEFLRTDSKDATIEVPAELREIIDDLVSSFRQQCRSAEETCALAFREFDSGMLKHLSKASRGELRDFSDHFRRRWNRLMNELFTGFNRQRWGLIQKYESWFDQTMEETFETLYQAELRRFGRSPRFYAYAAGLLAVGYLVGQTEGAPLPAVLATVAPLAALPLVYWGDCALRRGRPRDVQALDIELFRVDRRADFQGSHILKVGASNTAFAGMLGAAAFDRRGSRGGSSADPLLGLALGLAVGAIIDRVIHPTAQIRVGLLREYQQLMAAAQPQVTRYIVERNQALMEEIKEKIETNYESRMRKTVLLLAGKRA